MSDNEAIDKLLVKVEGSLSALKTMDIWLSKAIDDAINSHRGTFDHVDIAHMIKEKAAGMGSGLAFCVVE